MQSGDLEDTVSGVNCTLGDAVVFASDACNIVGPIGPRAKNNSHGIEVARLRFCALFQICHSVRIVNFDTKGVENIARDRANNSVGHQLGHITFKDARATRNRTSTSDLGGNVTFYVHSEDPAGVLKRAQELGGQVLMPLTEVAPETTIALFADPEGHVVGLM